MNTNENLVAESNNLHFGHLASVFLVAILLLSISWFKNPEMFKFRNRKGNSISAKLPKYYAYETPAELAQPLVAGATTQNLGPMVIGEDGQLTSVADLGEVLGVNSSDQHINLEAIKVVLVPDSEVSQQNYINTVQNIESKYLDIAGFELALSSSDQAKINEESIKMQKVLVELDTVPVPMSYKKFHQLKITQYRAGVDILNNFTEADVNPELINSKLNIFLQAEQALQEEKIHLIQS